MRREEFERLAIAELDALHRFARFLTRDADAAEDLVQDVYARAFRVQSIESFESRGSGMRAWLMTIARTSFYGRLEHEQAGERAVARRAREADSEERGGVEPPEASVIAGIDWEHVGPYVHKALDLLNPELRDVLWFWAVEGLKYREIAEALDVPIGTVMSRLHRARGQVARTLTADHAASAEISDRGFNISRAEPIRQGERR